jgi:hypothetical protein
MRLEFQLNKVQGFADLKEEKQSFQETIVLIYRLRRYGFKDAF